ncbi:amidohydrolase [Thermocladium modestius]|uniref:Amidohydrolase n=1 Tax=Thermocladium modestius TaxID=62609 RepID=A0A830GZA3_9CREN|nr:amidohydrolase family protein [Thermocladium modestius]GGP21412.1 amidohydrolase [Thermocladium modestius]
MGFIDAHTHLIFPRLIGVDLESLRRELRDGFTAVDYGSPSDVVRLMDELDIDYVVIMAYPASIYGNVGDLPIKVIKVVAEYGDRFAVFGGVDFQRVRDADEARRELERQYEAGISGLKVHPVHQWVKPNAYRPEEGGLKSLEAAYEFAEDNGLPVTIHTGTSAFSPARNKYGDPMLADDVSVDFPRLTILLAHAGRPIWMQSAFQLARIRSNIYLELSGIPPARLLSYLPRIGELSGKSIYGSDVGSPGVKGLGENLREFLSLDLPREALNAMTALNARQLIKPLQR